MISTGLRLEELKMDQSGDYWHFTFIQLQLFLLSRLVQVLHLLLEHVYSRYCDLFEGTQDLFPFCPLYGPYGEEIAGLDLDLAKQTHQLVNFRMFGLANSLFHSEL